MIAYIDESGAHGFNFQAEGTSSFFVVNSILVDEGKKQTVLDSFLRIKNEYFPNSELKSSKVGNKEHIRLKILEALTILDFRIYCLVVDKKKIHVNTGLRYKESFYKFIYGILYNRLFRTFNNIKVEADEMISSDFAESFKKYIIENHVADLFQQSNISFSKSTDTELLQLADIIGGSINRFYSKKSDINPLEILNDKVLGVYHWPEDRIQNTVTIQAGQEFEKEISELALLRIDDYIKRNLETRDKHEKLRVMFLSYVRAVFLYVSSTRFIHSYEILSYLKENTGEDIKEQYLRQNIVGPLRSEGILIVSDTAGYKVPSSKNDVLTFFNLFSRIIHPMIKRLEMSHSALYEATHGELDILAYPEYEYLRKVMKK